MSDAPRPEASIGLSELIAAVRSELELVDASRVERDGDSLLELREVELEIQFEVTKSKGKGRKDGGLDFRIVTAGEGPPPAGTQKLRVLYGPAFKLVELEEGDPTITDWLRVPPSVRIHVDPTTDP
jgi:hypothetical protein